MDSVIEIRELVKAYGDVRAVDGISLEVKSGEVFGILGPNGAGKTTTLEMVEGLRRPDGGVINIDGISVWPNPKKTKHLIGVQLQTTALLDFLTVQEIVRLFASFYGIWMDRSRVLRLLEEVALEKKAGAMVNQLSGGQQQRLSIALALVNDPKILFLDEPTTGLDPQARRKLWSVIERINREGKTIVLTTHYMEEAEVLCSRVAVMDHGRIIALATPEELISSLDNDARVTFTAKHQFDIAKLKELPSVCDVSRVDSSYTFYTGDVQKSITALLRLAELQQVRIENLSVSGANLEDVFLHLTGRGLREQ
ncbi:MAG: ABC transporter ATP-binding protein [Firmicutes bacterium]|nr:ABC transporter ATP-binding protein [Bacillota bacterium]